MPITGIAPDFMPNCVAYRSLTVPAKLLGVIINTVPFGTCET